MRYDAMYDVRYGYDAKRYDTLVRDNDGSPSPDRVREPIKFKADEPAFWSRRDYGWFFECFLTSTPTAGMGNLDVCTCSRTSRVTALRMGGNFDALVRENSCCVRL